MVGSYPKIFPIGHKSIRNIFDGEVEITEKLDGSQFCFGCLDGTIFIRSKSKQMSLDFPDGLFLQGVGYVKSIRNVLETELEGLAFYCEYLRRPKHNVIKYDNIPKHYLALFGVLQIRTGIFINNLDTYIQYLNIDKVPVLYKGHITVIDDIKNLLDTESYLGGSKIEGFVVKRYNVTHKIGEESFSVMSGKFVSERFKEVMQTQIKKGGDKTSLPTFIESYRTQARWDKAIQHLKERGELLDDYKDIGPIIKEVQNDIVEEEKEIILEFLWHEFGKTLLKRSIAGFPEYYKELLLNKSLEGDNND